MAIVGEVGAWVDDVLKGDEERRLQAEAYGLYHIPNGGQRAWYEFAGKIFELLGMKPDFAPTTTAEFGAKARRPAYSVLAHHKLKQLGLEELRSWAEALKASWSSRSLRSSSTPRSRTNRRGCRRA